MFLPIVLLNWCFKTLFRSFVLLHIITYSKLKDCESYALIALLRNNFLKLEIMLYESLLNCISKIFLKILRNILTNKFETYQTVEQAGFRKSYSTMCHIQIFRINWKDNTVFHGHLKIKIGRDQVSKVIYIHYKTI